MTSSWRWCPGIIWRLLTDLIACCAVFNKEEPLMRWPLDSNGDRSRRAKMGKLITFLADEEGRLVVIVLRSDEVSKVFELVTTAVLATSALPSANANNKHLSCTRVKTKKKHQKCHRNMSDNWLIYWAPERLRVTRRSFMTETPVSAPQLHPRRAVPRTGDCYAMLCYAGVARSSVRITQSVSHKRASSYGYKMELKITGEPSAAVVKDHHHGHQFKLFSKKEFKWCQAESTRCIAHTAHVPYAFSCELIKRRWNWMATMRQIGPLLERAVSIEFRKSLDQHIYQQKKRWGR